MNLVRYNWLKPEELPSITHDYQELARRDILVAEAAQITAVTTADEQALAVDLGQKLRGWLKEIEAARVEVKAPFRQLAELVDALAKEAAVPCKAALDRLSALVSLFQQQEAERVRLAEQARQEEIARLEIERQKKEEALKAIQTSMTTEKDLDEAIKAEAASKQAAADAYNRIAMPTPAAFRATGATTQKVMCYEVLDVHALYRARPELVRLEANAAAIRATVFAGMTVPGLRIWEETKTVISTRGSR